MAEQPNSSKDLGSFFGGLGSGMSDGLYDSFMSRLNAGKRILMSDNPRTFEGKVQAFYDQHKSLTRSDFDRIKGQHFGAGKKPGPPPAPPPPKSATGPAPLTSPLSPGLLASMAAAAASAPGYPTATPSPSPVQPRNSTWMPPRPASPPSPPSWPASMMGGGFPQPPPPPPPPSWPANMMPSPWPASMMGGRPPGSPWPANMAPPNAPYNINPGAGIFPRNMQPRVPKPPAPRPTRFQKFKSTFGSAYARQAKYGIASVRGAGQAALTAAFPEAAIVKEALKTLKSLVTAMKDFSEQVLESNRRLGQYNGQIAIAYTRLAISDFYRNTNLANRTATSSVELVRAVNRMRDSFQEYRVLQGNLLNQLAIGSARYFGNLGEAMSPFFAKLNEMIGRDPKAGGIQTLADIMTFPLTKFFDDLKEILEKKLGVKFPGVKAGGPDLGPWDQFAADVLKGRVGGPILPKAGPRPGIGGGAAINFGRGI